MDNPAFTANDELQSNEKDESNKQSNHSHESNQYSDDLLVDLTENTETTPAVADEHYSKDFTESPRTKLARYIPDVPFKIDNLSQLCDGNIFVNPVELTKGHQSIHVSLSVEDEFRDNEHVYSKSCDCSDKLLASLQQKASTVTRSVSEDCSQRPSAHLGRRISIVSSSKGKFMGIPVFRPGEKLVKSPSVTSAGQNSFRPPTRRISVREEKVKSRFTSEQKRIIFCLCLVNFTGYLSMSIIAPFFPREAAAKGMREALSGFVFSIYALVIMLTSPIFGKIIPIVGAKFILLAGISFCGACNALFGLLDKVNGETEFAVLCFVVRSFEALGASAFCTASCTILIDQFPDHIGTVFGFTETCYAVGMSIGPAIGGALYDVGGFGLPFFTLGGSVIVVVPCCWYLLQNVEDPNVVLSSSVSYKKLLFMPHVIIVCIILAVASQAQAFIDPTLEPHMRQYNLDPSIIGLLFLLLSGAYALSSPIVGWVSGKVENKYPIMMIGLILVTLSFLLLGPSNILPIEGSVWLSVVALILLGFSLAAAFIPTFESMFIAAMNGGLEDDINTYSAISGLWNSLFSLGGVTGPSLGGILSDIFTFPQAATLMAYCTLAAFVIAVIAWSNPCMCFGPFSLIENAEEKMASSHDSKEVFCEQTPLQDKNVHTYGSLSGCKKNPTA